ncbi:acyltransferase family protein [Phenylobacterium sp. VNQ135]|uniref:acyltransferase family protein n=1 Tax=Phenylobacterium sp. VNQ135 TaxID=3400922 RepID=UPI003C11F2B9
MSASSRRHDLDALRVGAFMLLILYHLGMFYVPWGWHVKSDHIVPALELPMGLLNPWRLTLLFVISGAATRFMMERLTAGRLAAQRSQRLLIPLLFGMLVIVAPQSWAEVVEKNGYAGGFLDFWPRYLTFDPSFGIILPTYNHLWFVAYLWVYTMVLAIAAPLLPRLDRLAARTLGGGGLFLVPVLAFGTYLATAGRAWGETHIVFADGYGHLQYGTAFLLGVLLARRDDAWERLQKARGWSLSVAIGIAIVGSVLARQGVEDAPGWPGAAFAFVREAYAWAVICALFGFARRYVRKGARLLSTLNEAVFPFYIIHQTAIVLAGHLLKPAGLPPLAEASAILGITVASCLATCGLALAVPALRLPLGLKPLARHPAPAPAAA